MINLNVQEALNIYRYSTGKTARTVKKELRELLWPDSKVSAQYVNLRKLLDGKTTRYSFEMVHAICEYTKVDANFLFKRIS